MLSAAFLGELLPGRTIPSFPATVPTSSSVLLMGASPCYGVILCSSYGCKEPSPWLWQMRQIKQDLTNNGISDKYITNLSCVMLGNTEVVICRTTGRSERIKKTKGKGEMDEMLLRDVTRYSSRGILTVRITRICEHWSLDGSDLFGINFVMIDSQLPPRSAPAVSELASVSPEALDPDHHQQPKGRRARRRQEMQQAKRRRARRRRQAKGRGFASVEDDDDSSTRNTIAAASSSLFLWWKTRACDTAAGLAGAAVATSFLHCCRSSPSPTAWVCQKEQQECRGGAATAARAGSEEQQQHGQGQRSSSSTGRAPPATGEKQPHGCARRGEGAARVRGRGRSMRVRGRSRITRASSWSTGSCPATPVGDRGGARAGARGGCAGARGGRAQA